jgi:hypothetical protein
MAEARGGKVESVSPTDRWMRLLYMVIFAIIGYAVYWLVVFLAVVQFGLTLLTGHPNENLKDFAAKLDAYLKSVTDFLGYATDIVPFPFSPLDQGAGSAAAKPALKRAGKATTKTSTKPIGR